MVRGTVRGIVCFHPTNLYAVVPRTKCRKEQREEKREENKSKEKKKEEEEKKIKVSVLRYNDEEEV